MLALTPSKGHTEGEPRGVEWNPEAMYCRFLWFLGFGSGPTKSWMTRRPVEEQKKIEES